jgi:hypothetical protein
MPTVIHCRTRACELTELAESEPKHRTKHLNDAGAWALVADRMEELEAMAERPVVAA